MTIAIEKARARSRTLVEPRIIEMPPERMAVVETIGNPSEVAKQAIQALYGAVFTLKFAEKKAGRDFKVRPLRARWPNAQEARPAEFRGVWGLPVPPLTKAVPQKVPGTPVRVDTWRYGTVAELLHLGSYAMERPTIERLQQFIHDQGYEIVGPHEEEYLSRPDAAVPKTLIRYAIKKRGRGEVGPRRS